MAFLPPLKDLVFLVLVLFNPPLLRCVRFPFHICVDLVCCFRHVYFYSIATVKETNIEVTRRDAEIMTFNGSTLMELRADCLFRVVSDLQELSTEKQLSALAADHPRSRTFQAVTGILPKAAPHTWRAAFGRTHGKSHY